MLFNNSKFGNDLSMAIKVSLFVDEQIEASHFPTPPPGTYFLLDNTCVPLLDNTDQELLVSL